ncbi:MAG: SH3 domain-containing protein [Clostridia bacterium]|nr:SH3 domain-containing protein [Clostridia bacterium]
MSAKHLTESNKTLVGILKQTPRKVKKAVAIACSAAVIAVSVPLISFSAGAAQTAIYASTTAYLNLRSGAGTNYSVIKVIDKNATVTVVDKSNKNWLKVKLADGTTGYCSADYLDITTDAATTTYLNMRKGAGTSYSIIKTLAPNTKVDILSFSGNSWAYVKLTDGTKGYICTDYVSYVAQTVQGSSSQTTTSAAAVKVTISETSKSLSVGSNFTLTATTNSGGTFTWTTSDKTVASVTSKGVVTGLKEGTATIKATDTKSNKTVSCTVKVIKTSVNSIKLPETSKQIKVSESYTIKPTTEPAGGAVKYGTSNKSVATVNDKGVVTGVSAGTAKITVSDTTGTISAEINVTVVNKTSITLSKSSASVDVGSGITLTAKLSDNSAVTWTSSNTNVASVNNGVVSGLKAGTATITASDSTGKITAKCTVTVKAVSSSGVSLSRYSAATTAGKSIYIKGYSTYSAGWSSSDTSIATVSNGFILTKKAGKAAISYTDRYGNRAVCIVTVSAAAPIKFTYSSPNSAVLNSNVKLIAITDKNRTNVRFRINVGGTYVYVNATEKKSEGNTYVWTGTYKVTKAGTFEYEAQSYNGKAWETCSDAKADIYVTSKTNSTTTSLDRLRASDEVIKFIGEKEGFVSQVYYDTIANNLPTIGHGLVIWEGDTFYNNLTASEGYALLVNTVNTGVYTQKVNDFLINNNIRFNQQQFDALVSFSYNLGTGWTSSSDLKNILLDSYGTISDGSTVTGTVTATSGLNLRKSYTTSSDVIKVLDYNEKVTLVSTQKYNSVWYKVKTSNGTVGYCSGTYLRLSTSGTTARDLNYVNKNALINEMLAYHHSGGVCYYGLLYRRADELEMFLYGDYKADGRSNKYNFPNPYCISFP